MRLIDADAFKEYMRKALEETRGCYPDNGEWAEAVTEQFCEDIDDQPTVEPERKKGEWLPDGKFGFWVCSSCKFPSEASAANLLYKYCPVCGADMRKGEGEKE